ncbi:uncharacterized protein LOC143012369 [Genypterus blacodes]|uniref:uncharacterized protein LOC143012369 n=1 Tax=Genypterus blacodes TaxID=154954 RepID=UPI003F7659BB
MCVNASACRKLRRKRTPRATSHACDIARECVWPCVCCHAVTMVRAALTKLLILVILTFIICLPDFFMLDRVTRVQFLCLPYQPCKQGSRERMGHNRRTGGAQVKREDGGICHPCQVLGEEKMEPACTQGCHSNVSDPGLESMSGSNDEDVRWFMCKTDMDMVPHNNSLSDLKGYLEVSVELQLEAQSLNLTMYGLSKNSSLYFHSPDEEEEEEDERVEDVKRENEASYCCLPLLPTSESTNYSCCLLGLANQTVLNATAKGKLPWKRTERDGWRCMFRILCLVLLCVTLLIVATLVLGQIYWGNRRYKPRVWPVNYDLTGQQLRVGEKHTEITAPKGMNACSFGPRYWSALSPIEEVETLDMPDTFLDENVDQPSYEITGAFNAHLYHRNHPSTSSLTEQQN